MYHIIPQLKTPWEHLSLDFIPRMPSGSLRINVAHRTLEGMKTGPILFRHVPSNLSILYCWPILHLFYMLQEGWQLSQRRSYGYMPCCTSGHISLYRCAGVVGFRHFWDPAKKKLCLGKEKKDMKFTEAKSSWWKN
jgi:hypothetical protein